MLPIDEGKLYAVEDVISANGGIIPLSKSCIYKLMKKGEIPSVRIGKRVFIPGTYLKALVA